jgi:hypothetical protein
MDDALVSETLEAMADRRTASATQKSLKPLRGVRGVAVGEIARLATAVWQESPPDADEDRSALSRLFGAAYEDGLIAIGLVAAVLPDDPHAALDLGMEWLERVDDISTADALGWLVIGPGITASKTSVDTLHRFAQHPHPYVRRAIVMAAMAWTPAKLEGPSAAPLRCRVGTKQVRFVEQAQAAALHNLMNAFIRDTDPSVRKAIRRVLRAWAKSDPPSIVAWAGQVSGGLPRLFKTEVQRAARAMERAP